MFSASCFSGHHFLLRLTFIILTKIECDEDFASLHSMHISKIWCNCIRRKNLISKCHLCNIFPVELLLEKSKSARQSFSFDTVEDGCLPYTLGHRKNVSDKTLGLSRKMMKNDTF